MYFNKIELIGFKSFADKTVIPFEHNVIGIVGPNGCGKSNVADAIRWVLGEQSAKNLRGANMQDVIFNGTQNRRSLSYCEVSLFFDNSTGIFPSEEYTEVVMTRKLFRSGESEYSINKKPSRLRDIINLLHDCGVSKEGYTIIGQGKVGEIMKSKPEDRRAIFEEAIGIAKTKNQKLENERKLLRTKENIARFSDILSEIERQLGPLSKQAETAREFLQLSEDLKYHEVNAYLYKFANANEIKHKINLRIDGLNEEISHRTAEYDEAEKTYSDSFNQIGNADVRISEIHEEILKKTVGLEEQRGFVKVYKEKISFFNSEIERLRTEITASDEKIEELQKNSRDKKQAELNLTEEINALETDIAKYTDELNRIVASLNMGEREQKQSTNIMIESLETLSEIQSNISGLSVEKNVITNRQQETLTKVEILKRKLEMLSDERVQFSAELQKINKDITSLKTEIEGTENGIRVTNEKISDANSKLFTLNGKRSQFEASSRFYTELRDSFEGYQEAVRRLMTTAKTDKTLAQRIKGVVASIIRTDSKYEQAMEIAIGNAVQNIVTENDTDAAYLIEYLKRNGWGRATFLPINTLKTRLDSSEILRAKNERGSLGLATELVSYDKYFETVIRFLLGNTLVCDTLDSARTIAKKYGFSFKIVTLEGDVVTPQGSMSGGSRRQNTANLLAVDNKVKTITESLKQINDEIATLEEKKSRSEKVCNELVDELNKMNQSFQERKQELVALKEKITANDGLITDVEAELDSYRETLKQINVRLTEIVLEQSNIEEGSEKLKEKKQTATLDAKKNETVFEEMKARRDELINKNTDAQSAIAKKKTERQTAKEEILRLTNDIGDLRSKIKDSEGIINKDEEIIQQLNSDAEKLTLSSTEQKEVNDLRAKLASFEELKDELNAKMMQADLNKKVTQGEITKLTEKKLGEEYSLEKVDTDLQYAAEKLWEDYQLNYESCILLKNDEYDITTSAQEINKVRRKINSLGNINANAINDFSEMNERYQGLVLQKQDLEEAAQNIETAIKQLTDEMTTKFNEGFEIIRVHFKKIFKELFGGGTADLTLDYSKVEDPLDAGVDIVAEPPGKKLQNISLLSGGEQALTSIAILFAILKLRPMPFCVLDEIEAPLDDANVERFAKYLKNFSVETQFIVITHKKVTMELTDALFGVTMEEKGVSKIVSVNLKDIGEIAVD